MAIQDFHAALDRIDSQDSTLSVLRQVRETEATTVVAELESAHWDPWY